MSNPVRERIGRAVRAIGRLAVWMAILTPALAGVVFGRALPQKPGQPSKSLPADIWAAGVQTAPIYDGRVMYAGDIWTLVGNDGTFGSQTRGILPNNKDLVALGINWGPSFEFPGGSKTDYLYFGSIWVGGVVGTDTLVSQGVTAGSAPANEFNGFELQSERIPLGMYYKDSVGSEQVRSCMYYDTLVLPSTSDPLRGGRHIPLGLEITQVTHASSPREVRNFVIWDLSIKNISDRAIDDLWLGVFQDNDIANPVNSLGYIDDVSGFMATWPSPTIPDYFDELNVAWSADNDGDPDPGGNFPPYSARGVIGIRILRAPEGAHVTWNWWTLGQGALDWAPSCAYDTRRFGGGIGLPEGDAPAYYVMSGAAAQCGPRGHQGIDYSQFEVGIDKSPEGWKKPPTRNFACDLADGLDTRNAIAVGPKSRLQPGESAQFTFAVIGARTFHRNGRNFVDNFQCTNPYPFIQNLDFSELALAAWWAGYFFDNPGRDTDGDKYFGAPLYRNGDTIPSGVDTIPIGFTGDHVPDFSTPITCPCPTNFAGCTPGEESDATLSDNVLISRPGELELRWTGRLIETQPDPIKGIIDFEGYRLYIADRNRLQDVPASGTGVDGYRLLSSWDREDFRRYTYNAQARAWDVDCEPPHSTEEWQTILSDPTFDPTLYNGPERPYRTNHYFRPQDFNRGNYIVDGNRVDTNLIQLVNTDSVISNDGSVTRWGEYRAVLKDLTPSKFYFVSLTAFDFGHPCQNQDPCESTPGDCKVTGVPIYSSEVVEDYWNRGGAQRDSVRVSVYPNPYKLSFEGSDGRTTSYRDQGFEGAPGQTFTEKDRRIHFINLPADAVVRIFTLDGDLVRTLDHPEITSGLSDYCSRVAWDLVSRNTQSVESGIYLYRVDSKLGAQMGKIVIIK